MSRLFRRRERGTPIQGATVRVPSIYEESVTGADGQCEAIACFRTTGISGRSAEMHLHGTMRVTATGYQTWESSFVSLLGPRYDYFHKGTSVTYAVTLIR